MDSMETRRVVLSSHDLEIKDSAAVIYTDGFHDGFARFLSTKDLADVIVVTSDGKEHELHSLILAHRSCFFYKALTADFKEKSTRRINLHIEKGLEVWPLMVEYFYTDKLPVTDQNVSALACLARQLMVDHVESFCMSYLKKRVGLDNCLQYLRDAVQYDIHELHEDCVAEAARGFHILFDGDVSELPVTTMLNILQHKELQVNCEQQVLHFVLEYLRKHTLEPDTVRLLCSEVRFAFLDNQVLGQLKAEDIIPQDLLLEGALCRLSHIDGDKGHLDSMPVPPRPTYCCQVSYGLPGGKTYVVRPLEEVWDHIANKATVEVSGVTEGDPMNVLSADSQAYFETNDSIDPAPWIAVHLPHNVTVTHFTRYTFAHGHRRTGYFRLRHWKTMVAADTSSNFVEVSHRGTSEQSDNVREVHVLSSQQQQPWRILKLVASGTQEDNVHRICLRNLKVYGMAKIDLMKQCRGMTVMSINAQPTTPKSR